MSKAKIYSPTKNAMQSGTGNASVWLLEFIPETPYFREGIMGWNAMSGTDRELHLKFPNKDAAIAYARKNGLDFELITPNTRKQQIRAYADKFAFGKVRP